MAETVMRYDVSPSALVEGERALLATGAPLDVRVPLPVFGRMLKRAGELTGEPSIGLFCGLDSSDSAFDLLAPLVSHVANFRHALHEIGQFQELVFDGSSMQLTESLGVARLRCEFPRLYDGTDHCIAEFMVGGLMRLLRGFGSARRDLRAAYFEHGRPSSTHAYAKIFQGRERFAQAFTGIEFAAEVLDRPHLLANPELQCAAHLQAEQRLSRLARPDILERIKAIMIRQPALCLTDMHDVAKELGMSVRSLRRRLTASGISYRSMSQDLLCERACMLLRNPSLTVQGVAGALGYEDTGAFHRAFKRWTGKTAWEYRHSLAIFPVAETTPR